VFSASTLRQRDRDTAYREALGVLDGGKLPKKLGNTASAGAGRDRRGKVTKATKKNAAANRSRVKLIG
jgi:hypothetical protein